jgi:hypothetical protein
VCCPTRGGGPAMRPGVSDISISDRTAGAAREPVLVVGHQAEAHIVLIAQHQAAVVGVDRYLVGNGGVVEDRSTAAPGPGQEHGLQPFLQLRCGAGAGRRWWRSVRRR